jgi:hypothetical protein
MQNLDIFKIKEKKRFSLRRIAKFIEVKQKTLKNPPQ